MSTTNILDLNNRIDALEKNGGGGGSADSAKRSDIATEFSATTAYTAGCFVYYEGKLYQFNADHAAGAWDPTDVVEANVTDQVVSNASAIAGLTASDVAYDNTTSGLTATNEQAAIDELAGDISGLTASGVAYVNTTSGLTATDVQEAVDEVAEKMGNTRMTKLWENSDPTQSMMADTQIMLSSSDYDLILWLVRVGTGSTNLVSAVSNKNGGITVDVTTSSGTSSRNINKTSDTIYTVSQASIGAVVHNEFLIPYQGYGIKLT